MGEVVIRHIEPSDRVTGLSLGHPEFAPLKAYLKKEARRHHEQSLARTYGVYTPQDDGKVRAYITLVAGEVAIKDGDEELVDGFNYKHYPAIKIARLAVDSELRGMELGRTLVRLAIGIAKDTICPAIGCRFVVVDAKRLSIGFYERCGFTAIDTQDNLARSEPVMFLDLHKLEVNGAAG
ncbi:GNAT family N-acetyltransferase [Pelagibacterium montanilacus]|uniref:GNAT family N-acetyltransferase n=1 Tax=Pelagibacterium montanilacus TaxID=2185280 RepID=UPI0013DE897C|nr:GNAT family N-acetyltransferase [Pelagibacterium montanilacus]